MDPGKILLLIVVLLGRQIIILKQVSAKHSSEVEPFSNQIKPNNCATAMDAFNHYLMDMKEEFHNKNPTEPISSDFRKECAEKWESLDSNTKEKYAKRVEDDRKRKGMECHRRRELGVRKSPVSPLSSFAWFCIDERNKVEEDLGDESRLAFIARELLKRWNSLDAEQKAKYDHLVQSKAKERFQKELTSSKKKNAGREDDDYEDDLDDYNNRNSTPRTCTMSAYAFFVDKMRREHQTKHPDEEIKFIEFSKKCTEAWKLLSKEELSDWRLQAQLEANRANDETSKIHADKLNIKRLIKGFDWFCGENRQQVEESLDEPGEDLIEKELLKRWNSLDANSKSKYEDLEAYDRARYEMDSASTGTSRRED